MSLAPPVPQHLQALAVANERRLAAVAVKNELAADDITLAEALDDPRSGSLTIVALLGAQHRWGGVRAGKLLAGLRIHERKRVRDLTMRQRGVIVRAVGR